MTSFQESWTRPPAEWAFYVLTLSSPLEESSVLHRTLKRPSVKKGLADTEISATAHVSGRHSQPGYLNYCHTLPYKLLAQANGHPHQCRNRDCVSAALQLLLAGFGVLHQVPSPSLAGLLSLWELEDNQWETHISIRGKLPLKVHIMWPECHWVKGCRWEWSKVVQKTRDCAFAKLKSQWTDRKKEVREAI